MDKNLRNVFLDYITWSYYSRVFSWTWTFFPLVVLGSWQNWAFLAISTLHQTSTCITTGEPSLSPHYHFKSIVYVSVHSWCCTFYEFCKCLMTHIYHYTVTQNSNTALKLLSAPPLVLFWMYRGIPHFIALCFIELYRYFFFSFFTNWKICGNLVLPGDD